MAESGYCSCRDSCEDREDPKKRCTNEQEYRDALDLLEDKEYEANEATARLRPKYPTKRYPAQPKSDINFDPEEFFPRT